MIVKNGISKEHSERLKGYLDELWIIQNELKDKTVMQKVKPALKAS